MKYVKKLNLYKAWAAPKQCKILNSRWSNNFDPLPPNFRNGSSNVLGRSLSKGIFFFINLNPENSVSWLRHERLKPFDIPY